MTQAMTPHVDDPETAATTEPAVAPPVPASPTPAGGGWAPATPQPAPGFVYAVGRIEPRFPTQAVEKEFAQVAGRADTAGLADRELLLALLSERENRYLARQLCWVFIIEGIDTYLLSPRDPADLDLLVESLRPVPQPSDIDVVIGVLGPIAPPEMCNALMVPIVVFDQLYSFDTKTLLGSIPAPKGVKADTWNASTEEVFARIRQMADNAGATDSDRALNYLAMRDPSIYSLAAEKFTQDTSLARISTQVSRLSGARVIEDVTFTYTNRKTDVDEMYLVRVDVTEEFPFLVTKLSPITGRA